jgi:hypothetical protein
MTGFTYRPKGKTRIAAEEDMALGSNDERLEDAHRRGIKVTFLPQSYRGSFSRRSRSPVEFGAA